MPSSQSAQREKRQRKIRSYAYVQGTSAASGNCSRAWNLGSVSRNVLSAWIHGLLDMACSIFSDIAWTGQYLVVREHIVSVPLTHVAQ